MHVKYTNGIVDTYPYSIGQLRRDNPNTSFPKIIPDAVLQDWGVYAVTVADEPSYTKRTQTLSQNTSPTLVNSVWTLGWTVTDKTSDEITEYDNDVAARNRAIRDAKLAETDWWASSDLTMTSEQTAYRQALRDITSHANWPHLDAADWPTKP
jgi:hypothetical protein